MRVLDADALIAFLLGEPAMPEVIEIMRSPERTAISAVNLAEAVDRLVRTGKRPAERVQLQIERVATGGLRIAPVDRRTGEAAGHIRARHYDRRRNAISLADCVALATAKRLSASLATSDPALTRTALAEDVDVVPLPNSRGERPSLSS